MIFEKSTKEQIKILIIDDEREFSESLSMRLEKYGFEVLMAMDGEEGIKLAQESLPDLILLDIMMPKVDGFEVISRLKKISRLVDVPVIMLTAKTDQDAMDRSYNAGITDFITKPLDAKKLIKRIRKILENR